MEYARSILDERTVHAVLGGFHLLRLTDELWRFVWSNHHLIVDRWCLGLIYRERHGPGNIGLESVVLMILYFGGLAILTTAL